MNILRIAIVALLIYLLWSFLGFALRVRKLIHGAREATRQPQLNNNLVKCAHCQLYITDQEAISREGAFFCSTQHAQDFRS